MRHLRSFRFYYLRYPERAVRSQHIRKKGKIINNDERPQMISTNIGGLWLHFHITIHTLQDINSSSPNTRGGSLRWKASDMGRNPCHRLVQCPAAHSNSQTNQPESGSLLSSCRGTCDFASLGVPVLNDSLTWGYHPAPTLVEIRDMHAVDSNCSLDCGGDCVLRILCSPAMSTETRR